MAIVKMQKVAIVAMRSLQEDILQLLHEEGVLEVSEAREGAKADHSEVKFREAELEFAIATLTPLASKETIALTKKKATVEEVIHTATHIDIRGIIDRLHAIDKEDHELKKSLQEVRGQPTGSSSASAEQAAFFSGKVDERSMKGGSGAGFAQAPTSGRAKEEETRIQRKLEEHRLQRAQLSSELPSLMLAKQYLKWLDEKQGVRESLRQTQLTVTLLGWLPKHKIPVLEKKLHALSPATAILKVPHGEHETPPVELKNPAWLTPFESVTKLYGLPKYDEMDPTPYLSLFFILFFALCLTDAGYGLVQAIVMGIVLLKMKKNVHNAPLLWLLFVSGIVTVLVSIPFGGWFGMTPAQAPAFMTELRADGSLWFKGQIWNLGDQIGINFLQNLSLALGIIHLSFGMMIAAYWKIRNGNFGGAFWSDGSSLAIIAALLLYVFGPADWKQIFLYGIYAALVFMIWGKGYGHPPLKRPLFGLLQTLNFFLGMMGNVLSYLRILALGLVTGALAFTVNLVADQIGVMLPWFIAIPFSILVYIVGHTMSIVLNILGAFIHSGRLQFVEFFSQFFEGGGRPFRPFMRTTT